MKYTSLFIIKKMDCAAEKELISMKLSENKNIIQLKFDVSKRMLEIIHLGESKDIQRKLAELKLGENHISTKVFDGEISIQKTQKRLLIYVFLINFFFFLIEICTGIISHSLGLIADSMDMLADSIVYLMSLLVVGKHIAKKRKIAHASGYLQIILASYGLYEVINRYVYALEIPDFKVMFVISLFALLANIVCLKILNTENSKEVHMEASKIFTSNDILINLGVMLSAILVAMTNSLLPDLVIAGIIFILVLLGAKRILSL